MKRILAGTLLSLLVLSAPAYGAETLVLYDDFNASAYINRAKWTTGTLDAYETYRNTVLVATGDREVQLEARGYGFRANSFVSGLPGQGRSTTNRLKFRVPNEDAIRAIKATVKVNKVAVGNCTTVGADRTVARFRMNGFFFNTGTGEPNRATDDVFARLEIRRYLGHPNYPAANQLEVRALVRRCIDQDCVMDQTLYDQVLGTVLTGQSNTLLLQWDPAANQFVFQLNADAPFTYAYTLPDTWAPQGNMDKKYLGINHWLPNCGPAQTAAFMSVNVDDVYVNGAALAVPAAVQSVVGVEESDAGGEIGPSER